MIARRFSVAIAKTFLSNLFGFDWWLDKTLSDNLAKFAALITLRKVYQDYKDSDKFDFLLENFAELNLMTFHVDLINRRKKFRFKGLGKDLGEVIDPLSEGFQWNYTFIDSSYNKVTHLFSFYPEGFFKKLISTLVEKYAWKSINREKFTSELKAQAKEFGLNLPEKSDPANYIQPIFFRRFFGVVNVDIKQGTIDIRQEHAYSGKLTPLSFTISFLNSDNEIVSTQKIIMPATKTFSVPVEVTDYEYYIANSDLGCDSVFNDVDQKNIAKVYERFLDIPMPAQCQAFKSLFYRMYLTSEGKEEFKELAQKIAENFPAVKQKKFILSIKSIHSVFKEDVVTKLFDTIKDRMIAEDDFSFYSAIDHLKKMDESSQASAVIDLFDGANEEVQMTAQPTTIDYRYLTSVLYDLNVTKEQQDRILAVIKEHNRREYDLVQESLLAPYQGAEENNAYGVNPQKIAHYQNQIDRVITFLQENKYQKINDKRREFLAVLSGVGGIFTIKCFLNLSPWIVGEANKFVEDKKYMELAQLVNTFCPFDRRAWGQLTGLPQKLKEQNAPFFIVRHIEKQLFMRGVLHDTS